RAGSARGHGAQIMHHLLTLLACLLAFGCLALAMERHQEDLFSRRLGSAATATWRTTGWMSLCASLVPALHAPSLWSVGLVAWFGHLSVAAGIVYVALLLAPRKRSRRTQR